MASSNKKKDKQPLNLEEQEQNYNLIAGIANNFCIEVKNQILRLLDDQKISLGVPIEYRVKTWDSMAIKLEELSDRIIDVKEIQDLAGLRVILLFNRDVEKVCKLLLDNFEVIKQYDTQERLGQDQFGYASIHFIIKLPKEWLSVPTLSDFTESIAEIQVRTLAQHIWAAASYTLQYKQTESVPPSVLRGVYRVSALLETVDLEFERVLKERDLYIETADISSAEEKLNVNSLEKTLDSLFPPENKKGNESYAEALKELFYFDIQTPEQLTGLIEKQMDRVIKREKSYKQTKNVDVFFNHIGMLRTAINYEYNFHFSKENRKKIHSTE